MPITPFHFGPGLLGKGLLPAKLSVTAFVAAQIVIDLESAYYLFVVREWPVHRWAHTFLAASLIGLAVGWAVWAVGRRRAWVGKGVASLSEVALWPCLVGGVVGGASHPFLDGIMHQDIQPLRPVSTDNPLLGLISVGLLHLLCVAAGVLGGILLTVRSGGRGIVDDRMQR